MRRSDSSTWRRSSEPADNSSPHVVAQQKLADGMLTSWCHATSHIVSRCSCDVSSAHPLVEELHLTSVLSAMAFICASICSSRLSICGVCRSARSVCRSTEASVDLLELLVDRFRSAWLTAAIRSSRATSASMSG